MFIDASVIVAILASEPGSQELEKQMGDAGGPFFVSPLVRFEATVALARQKSLHRKSSSTLLRQTARTVDAFIEDIGAEEIAISSEIGHLALEVSATYGKSVGHAAQLNFGDCFAYACAKTLGMPLIYKGDDFARTDLA
jgi:ribonuclease VapC